MEEKRDIRKKSVNVTRFQFLGKLLLLSPRVIVVQS